MPSQSASDAKEAEIQRLKSIEGTTTWHAGPEGALPTEEYLAFFGRLKAHLGKYQPEARWHRQMCDDIGVTGWVYDDKEADRVLGFIQNRPIHSITHGTYRTPKGEMAWFCKIRFQTNTPNTLFPPILNLYIVKTPTGFKLNGLAQDHC